MILAGLMSLVQVCCLPGFLLLQFFPVRGALTRALFAFALSLFANYQIVFLLAATGLYQRPVILTLFVLELAGAGWVILACKRPSASPAADIHWDEPLAEWPRILPLRYLLAPLVVLTPLWLMRFWLPKIPFGFGGFNSSYLWLMRFWLPKIPGAFNQWDDLVSWNVWAVQWARNALPQWCRFYPQLMTANWSLTYVFTSQTSVHFFAKAFMGLFPIGMLLLFLPIARVTRSLAALVAVPVCGYLLLFLFGGLIGEGFADLPVAFFSLAAFLAFQLGWERELSTRHAVLLTTLLAAAAAVTKQAGLYTLIGALVTNGALMARARLPRAQTLALAGLATAIVILGVAPWYLRETVTLAQGHNVSEFKYQTTDLYAGRPPLARIPGATRAIAGALLRMKGPAGGPATAAMLAAFALAAFFAWRRQVGRSALLFALPFCFLWAAFFSYGWRNIALAIPFLALVVAVGGLQIAETLRRFCAPVASATLPHARFVPAILLVALIPLGVWADRRWPAEVLNRRQDAMLRQAYGPELNAALYDYARSPGFHGAVLTNYEILGQLPDLATLYRRYHFEIGDNIEALRARLASPGDPVAYMLVPSYAAPRLRQYIIARGREIFCSGDWTLYEVLKEAPAHPPGIAQTPENP